MERLQTWWVTALYMPIDGDSCMEIPGDCEVVKVADAQATIAALQARVQELEDDRGAWKEIAQDWSAAAKLAEQPEEFYEGYSAAVMNAMRALLTKARAEFTQRTAELEAAKHCYADLLAKYQNLVAWYDKQNGTPCEQVRHKQEVADLQAELERVRGELDHAKKMEAVQKEVADNQTWHVQKLRALILALPKMEEEHGRDADNQITPGTV